MKNFLTEKLMIDTRHGSNCSLEVCTAGDPDADRLIFSGTASDCLRKTMTHELAMGGDEYFCLYTDQGSFDGTNFEAISWRMGYNPEDLRQTLCAKESLADKIQSASARAGTEKTADISRDHGFVPEM